jgi:uncharacterized membrane protein YfcA
MQVLTIGLAALAVSFVFSMMGAGGSQILVPILFWLGLDFKTGAIPIGLLAAAITCFSAGGLYYRRGLVRLSTAWPFALAVLIGSPLGALVARPTSSTALMIVFAAVNIAVGLLVLRGRSMVGGELPRRRELTFDMTVGWPIVLAVSLASLIGSQVGARYMSERMESRTIRILFTAVMILVGVVILIQAL